MYIYGPLYFEVDAGCFVINVKNLLTLIIFAKELIGGVAVLWVGHRTGEVAGSRPCRPPPHSGLGQATCASL